MRVFPTKMLEQCFTIGLNQAYRYCPMKLSITVHPELVLDYEKLPEKHPTQWIVKQKPPMEKLSLDDPNYYVFHTRDDFDGLKLTEPDTLFCGRGVQQTAMHLAAQLGATEIVLVGVDMCALGDEHHGHDQHVKFHGLSPADVYAEYRKFTAKARRILRETHGVNTLTLSPLLGADHGTEDYLRLCKEFDLPRLPKPKDTSTYKRKRTDA